VRVFSKLLPRRWWQWSVLAFFALVLILIIFLPRILRGMIVAQLAHETTAQVQIEDVDLNLFLRSLTIHGVALTLPEEEQPVIAIKRLHGTLRLSALLLRREVVIEEIQLDDAQVATVLEADGRFNLAKLLPPPPPEPVPDDDLPTLTVERVHLEEVGVTFRDLTHTPEIYASLSLHEVTTGAINLQAQGLAAPIQVALKGQLNGRELLAGSFTADGQAFWNRSETQIDATMNVQQFAVAFIEPYLRAVFRGQQLAGMADGQLHYHLQNGGEQPPAHALSGSVTIADLSFVDPAANRPALHVANGQIMVDGVDFLRRDIRIASVALRDSELLLLQTGAGLNWGTFFPRESETGAQDRHPRGEAKSWRFTIRDAQANGGEVVFRDDSWAETETVKIVPKQLTLQGLGSDVQETPIHFQLGVGAGNVAGDGTLRFSPFGVEAQMSLAELWLTPLQPLLVHAAAVKQVDAVLNGKVHAKFVGEEGNPRLHLAGALDAAAVSAEGVPTPNSSLLLQSSHLEVREGSTILPTLDLGVQGQISNVTVNNLPQGNVFVETIDGELRLKQQPALEAAAQVMTGPGSGASEISAQGAVLVKGFVVRQGPDNVEVLSCYQARAQLHKQSRILPLDLRFTEVALEYPYVQGFRTEAGQIQLEKPVSVTEISPEVASAAQETPKAEKLPDTIPVSTPTKPHRVHLEHLTLVGGQLYFEDYAVTPFQTIYWQDIGVDLKGGQYPLARPTSFTFHAFNMDGAPIDVRGSTQRQGGQLVTKVDGTIDRLTLSRFNVYLAPQLGYRVRQGAVSVKWNLRMPGDLLHADAAVTVHDLGLGGKENASGLEEQVGLSMSLIVALLKDLNGNINLQLPVEGRLSEPGFHFGGSVWRAIRDVLIGAVTSPLKLLGAVFSKENKLEDFVLEPIAFLPGTDLPTNPGKEQLQRLKLFLTQRPELNLQLSSSSGPADQQVMQDRLILLQLQSVAQVSPPQPSSDTEQGAEVQTVAPEQEVEQFLTHRVNREAGKPPALSEQATVLLTALREKTTVDPQTLAQLSQERVQYVTNVLTEGGGVAADRLQFSPDKLRGHGAPEVQYMIQARTEQTKK